MILILSFVAVILGLISISSQSYSWQIKVIVIGSTIGFIPIFLGILAIIEKIRDWKFDRDVAKGRRKNQYTTILTGIWTVKKTK